MGYCDGRHPGLQKYRAAREKGTQKAILRKEIAKNNPALASDPKKLEAVVDGAWRAKYQTRTIEVQSKGRRGKGRRHGKPTKRKVVVETV